MEFVTAVTAPIDSDQQCTEGEAAVVVAALPEPAAVLIHVDVRYYRWN